MNNRPFLILLIISIGLNCAAAGALVHSYFFTPGEQPFRQADGLGEAAGQNYKTGPPGMFNRQGRGIGRHVRKQRSHIHELQNQLIAQLMAEEPDRKKIHALCEDISRNQALLQKTIVERILEDIKDLPPENKKQYLSAIKKRMQRGRHTGRGHRHNKIGRGKGRFSGD